MPIKPPAFIERTYPTFSTPTRSGKISTAIILWILGIPIPIIILIFLIKGCVG